MGLNAAAMHATAMGLQSKVWTIKEFGLNPNKERDEPRSARTGSSGLAYSLGGVDAVEGGGSWPLEPLAVAVFAFMLQFASKKSC